MEILTAVTLELVRQEGRNWEACAGCPATHDPFTKGSVCHYLTNLANAKMGGFSSCGGGATWRVKARATKLSEEEEVKVLAYVEAAKVYIEKQTEYIKQLERSLKDAREEVNLLWHKLNV